MTFVAPRRSRYFLALALACAMLVTVSACSEEDSPAGSGPPPAALLGTWNATSFNALGQDLIAQGMGISFVFDAAGTYTFNVTNDQAGFCDVGPDCSDGGSYSATATQITLDPGTVDQAVLNYAITGSTMSVTATVDGIPITATFAKQ